MIRAAGKVVCRVRSAVDADSICFGKTGVLREAGQRASDLRRFKLKARQMEDDVRVMMGALEDVGNVLKLIRPRDVLRARESVKKVLRRMRNRGYIQ